MCFGCRSISLFAVGCGQAKTDETAVKAADAEQPTTAKADPAAAKAAIQELETAWSVADNARDANAVAAFYADDAQSLATDKPTLVGNAAIKKDIEEGFAKREKGSKVSYDVMYVYASDNHITEVGKINRMDSTGKTTSTGKYMAVWEKRDGKWLCIRDIGNEDAPKK